MAVKSSRQSRLVINTKRRWLDEMNSKFEGEEYQRLCRLRPAVEGLMKKIKPKYLHGRVLFRRLRKVKTRMTLRAIGLNFKRYWAWIVELLSFLVEILESRSKQLVFLGNR